MEDETRSVAIEVFVRPKPKTYSFLVDNCKYKKAKDVNKNVVATISDHEYKDVLLNMNVEDTQLMEFKVKTIKWEHIKSRKFHCLALMTKYIFKTVDMMD